MAKQTFKNAGAHLGGFLHTPLFTKMALLNAKRFDVFQLKKNKTKQENIVHISAQRIAQ